MDERLAGPTAQQATQESHLMAAADPSNRSDATRIGTPLDYSESVYRFYLELADCGPATRRLIEEFLPPYHAMRLVALDYGFEFEMPIQCAPDLVRLLLSRNIAIYQLVRLAKTKADWRWQPA
jgi:hypothetical protein